MLAEITTQEILEKVTEDVADAGFVVVDESWSSESFPGLDGILVGLEKRAISRIEIVLAFGDHVWFDDVNMIYISGHVALVNRKQ